MLMLCAPSSNTRSYTRRSVPLSLRWSILFRFGSVFQQCIALQWLVLVVSQSVIDKITYRALSGKKKGRFWIWCIMHLSSSWMQTVWMNNLWVACFLWNWIKSGELYLSVSGRNTFGRCIEKLYLIRLVRPTFKKRLGWGILTLLEVVGCCWYRWYFKTKYGQLIILSL